MNSVDDKAQINESVADTDNIIIGVIGDEFSVKSAVCTKLSIPKHVKFQFSFRKNKYIGTRFGRNNAMIIDIECAEKYHSNAINTIADWDVIIYAISWTGYDDEKSERLMRRYLEIAHVFRVKHIIVAITKIHYNSTSFERATNRVKDIMKKTNIEKYDILPVAEEGEDIEFIANCPSMKWYDGPILTDKLSDIKPSREYKEDPFLLTVTHFYKNRGVIIGKVRRGMVSVGERIKVFPTGIKGQINSIQIHCESVSSAYCGNHVRITLKMKNEPKLDIKRGDIMQIDENPDQTEPVEAVVFRFSATIYVQRNKMLIKDSRKRASSIPRILIQSESNLSGTDEHKSEYIAVVLFGSVKVGDFVEVVDNGRKYGSIHSIKEMTSGSAVQEAKSGDTIRIQVNELMSSWEKMAQFTGRRRDGTIHHFGPYVPLQLRQGDRLNAPWSDPDPISKMYLKTAKSGIRFIFNIFIGNGTAECCIHSIKWKKNANGKRIDNPEYLEQGDTAKVIIEVLQPIHVTPYSEYPEFGAFVMVYSHSNEITESFVIGKVNKIIETTSLKSIYPKISTAFSFCRRIKQIIEDTSNILNSNSDFYPCECTKRLNEMRGDHHLMTVSKMKPSYSLRVYWNERNVCMAQYGVVMSCGFGGIKQHELVLSLCNQMGRMLQRLIPMEVVQIIKLYSKRIRKAFHKDPDASKWKPIEQIAKHDICRMVHVGICESIHVGSDRLYLEENGTVWEEAWRWPVGGGQPRRYPVIQQYFVENKIVIKDVAIGGRPHCLAVDDSHRVYSWGGWHGNTWGQCGLGHESEVTTPTMVTFPFSDDEIMEKCNAVQCGYRHSYVCFRVKRQDELGREYAVDKHFMFGYNKENQCLTFDGRNKVLTPFCINETVKVNYGGEIDDVFVECCDEDGQWNSYTLHNGGDVTRVVVKKYYQFA